MHAQDHTMIPQIDVFPSLVRPAQAISGCSAFCLVKKDSFSSSHVCLGFVNCQLQYIGWNVGSTIHTTGCLDEKWTRFFIESHKLTLFQAFQRYVCVHGHKLPLCETWHSNKKFYKAQSCFYSKIVDMRINGLSIHIKQYSSYLRGQLDGAKRLLLCFCLCRGFAEKDELAKKGPWRCYGSEENGN